LDTTKKSNYQKMVDGEPFTGVDPVLWQMQAKTQALIAAYHALPPDDTDAQRKAVRAIVGEMAGDALIVPPFFMEYGVHIRLGDRVFVNRGSVFLDSALVTLGDGTMVGPNVQFLTVGHPVKPEERIVETPGAPILPFRPVAFAKPITVGRMCWIGARSFCQGSQLATGPQSGRGRW
jgi:maltose O-acetyltransferase